MELNSRNIMITWLFYIRAIKNFMKDLLTSSRETCPLNWMFSTCAMLKFSTIEEFILQIATSETLIMLWYTVMQGLFSDLQSRFCKTLKFMLVSILSHYWITDYLKKLTFTSCSTSLGQRKENYIGLVLKSLCLDSLLIPRSHNFKKYWKQIMKVFGQMSRSHLSSLGTSKLWVKKEIP